MNESIPSLNEPWLGYSGRSVMNLIQDELHARGIININTLPEVTIPIDGFNLSSALLALNEWGRVLDDEKPGCMITFWEDDTWKIYRYNLSTISEFYDETKWSQISDKAEIFVTEDEYLDLVNQDLVNPDAVYYITAPSDENSIKGEKGDPGPQGEKGEKGDKGDTGELGPQGEKGLLFADLTDVERELLRGPRGIGIKNVTLDDNYCAIITFDDNTFVRTASLRGPEGPIGSLGIQGYKGERGEQGIKGDTGVGISQIFVINGELHINMSDGTSYNLGSIVGPQGPLGILGDPGLTDEEIAAVRSVPKLPEPTTVGTYDYKLRVTKTSMGLTYSWILLS